MSGDFLQLPPVRRSCDVQVSYCFETKVWEDLNFETVILQTAHRQTDEEFLSVLQEMRCGSLTEEGRAYLEARVVSVEQDALGKDGTPCVYAKNDQVDKINQQRFRELSGPSHTFECRDSGNSDWFGALHDLAPQQMELKLGAQVMCTRNLPGMDGPKNGSVGTITHFDSSGKAADPCHYFCDS